MAQEERRLMRRRKEFADQADALRHTIYPKPSLPGEAAAYPLNYEHDRGRDKPKAYTGYGTAEDAANPADRQDPRALELPEFGPPGRPGSHPTVNWR